MIRSATVSLCDRYRYRLGRRWGYGKAMAFVMLNPSAADGSQDDPTIRRCVGFARSHGFAAIDVVNLFAYRSTDPRELKRAGYLIGPENDLHIALATQEAGLVCVAWGANGRNLVRSGEVLQMLRRNGVLPHCLAVTRDCMPQHPLMARADLKVKPYDLATIDAELARRP